MFKRIKNEECELLVTLNEPLTTDSCCKLVLELVKYLLYRKQQVPVTYEYLLKLEKSSAGVSDRCLTTAKSTLTCLQNISDHLNLELNGGNAVVKQIAIFMGATILSPKLCVRVSLPPGILSGRSHHSQQHPTRRPLLNLMRSITESDVFQEAMTLPLLPTNTFLLIQKRDCNNTSKVSEFFLPKPRYDLPAQITGGNRFNIKLDDRQNQGDDIWNCSCADTVRVYQDRDSSHSDLGASLNSTDLKNLNSETKSEWFDDKMYQWYQSRDVIKGFKLSR